MTFDNNFYMQLPLPLSEEEETKYIQQYYYEKNQKAREKLIVHNLRLVTFIIHKYFSNSKYDFDDMFSVGAMALEKAIDCYNPEKGVLPSTFLAACVKKKILNYFREENKHQNIVSLNSPVYSDKDGNELDIEDTLSDDEELEETSVNKIYTNEMMEILAPYIASMPPHKRQIVEMTFGFNGQKQKTQNEIAQMLNLSQAQISRILDACLDDFSHILDGTFKEKPENLRNITDVQALFERYLKRPYTEDNLKLFNRFLETLKEKPKFYLEAFFGINGVEKLSQPEIAKKVGISASNVSESLRIHLAKFVQILDGERPLVLSKINSPENKHLLSPEELLFKKYIQLPYTEENKALLSQFIAVLDENKRFILESMLGLNNKPKLAQNEIAKQLGISQSLTSGMFYRCIKKFVSIAEGKHPMPISEEQKNLQKEIKRKTKEHGVEVLFEKYLKKPYNDENKSRLDSFLQALDEKRLFIFESYFSLNGRKRLNLSELAKVYDLSSSAIHIILRKTIKTAAAVLNGTVEPSNAVSMQQKNRTISGEEALFVNYLKRPFSAENREKLNAFLAAVDEKKRFIIESYFGLNGKEKMLQRDIADQVACAQTNISSYIVRFRETFCEVLDGQRSMPKQKETPEQIELNFKQKLFEQHFQKPYNQTTINAVNAFLEELNDNHRYMIEHYFGLNGKPRKSQTEIGEDLKVTRSRVNQIIQKDCAKFIKQTDETKEQRFFKKYIKVPYSEENLNKMWNYLDTLPNNKKLLFLQVFGLRGVTRIKLSVLATQINLSSVYDIVNHITKQINAILDSGEDIEQKQA